jgi:hypothetical protein
MDRYGYGDGKPGNPSVGHVATTQLKDIKKRLPLRVLSPSDWEHWTTWGYVVVKNAIPEANIRRLVDLLWTFQEMDPRDPASWYKPPAARQRDEGAQQQRHGGGL